MAVSWRTVAVMATCLLLYCWIALPVQTSANNCSIEYSNMAINYNSTGILGCSSPSISSPRWWRSTSPCGVFTNHNVCTGNSCLLPVDTSIQRYFYYCCTSSMATDVLSLNDNERICYRIQVCTALMSMNSQGATIAFFNEPVQIFIDIFSEPVPIQTLSLFLMYNSTSLLLNDTTFVSNTSIGDSAQLVWQYVVFIPDLDSKVEKAELMFSVNYMHKNDSCNSDSTGQISYNIQVLRRSGPPPTCTCMYNTTMPPVTCGDVGGLSTPSGTEPMAFMIATYILVSILIILIILVIASFPTVYGIIQCLKNRRYRCSNQFDDPNRYGITGETPLVEHPGGYSRVNSNTSTPASSVNPPPTNNHPLSLQFRRDPLPTNGALSTPGSGVNTPTPSASIHDRLLPEIPQTTAAGNHRTMETIPEAVEGGERNDGVPVVYEHLNNDVCLPNQRTDSSPTDV